jgi:protein-L-isoaspartate(D-aspartate) O-methyltransferase
MVEHQLAARSIRDPGVLAAFGRVPREEFVDVRQRRYAYDDCPLPLDYGQTISQPYVVAITVEALALTGQERVLEIGTGSGYAAAVLACLAREVHTVERIGALAESAVARLTRLGFASVFVHHADGTLGWPAAAPYDAIAVAASAPRPPPALLAQLAIGGRLVLPTGSEHGQHLVRIVRCADERYEEQDLGEVRFVPLVGEQGWPATSPG